MNQKQLLILVVVLAVLGTAGVMLVKKNSASWQGGGSGAGEKLMGDLPVGEELALISIRDGTNSLTLAKEEEIWIVKERGNYPANYPEISRTVLKLRDLKAGQVEEVGASQLARLELLEPGAAEGAGTLIEFRDTSDQPLASLLLGKQQTRKESRPSQFGEGEEMDVPVGRWVMNPATKTQVALVSDPLSNLSVEPPAWLHKDFFKVQKVKSIAVNYPDHATNSFKLSRETETGDWTLAGLGNQEALDTSKTSSFNYALSNPSFDDVIVEADAAELGLDKPTTVTIETFEGFTYDLKAGRKQEEKIPMRITVTASYPREREAVADEDESVKAQKDKEFADTLKSRDEKLKQEQALGKWTYLVASWTLDSVLKQRGDLLKAEDKAAAPDTPDAADLTKDLLDLPPPQ